jgi:hypothetical protein
MHRKNKKSQVYVPGLIFSIIVVLAIAGTIVYVLKGKTYTVFPTHTNESGSQTWILTCEGESVKVILTPVTYSSTFSETADSHGWVYNPPGIQPIHIPVSGQVFHTGGGDRWEFHNLFNDGTIKIDIWGEGTANGQYPNATMVTGTMRETVDTPMGSNNVDTVWTGVRK